MSLFCTITVFAQQAGNPPTSFPAMKEWKTADEVTFGGAIDEIVAKNPIGAPGGLNLSMTGSQQVLFVSLGANLSSALKQELIPGQMIRVTGLVETLNGATYLLARELQIGDQKIEIRNAHGF